MGKVEKSKLAGLRGNRGRWCGLRNAECGLTVGDWGRGWASCEGQASHATPLNGVGHGQGLAVVARITVAGRSNRDRRFRQPGPPSQMALQREVRTNPMLQETVLPQLGPICQRLMVVNWWGCHLPPKPRTCILTASPPHSPPFLLTAAFWIMLC